MLQVVFPYVMKFKRLIKKVGFIHGVKIIFKKLFGENNCNEERGNDVNNFYSFVQKKPFGEIYENCIVEKSTITWLIPDFEIGSGGHQTIFRTVYHLERSGFRCHLVILEPSHFSSGEMARKTIQKHFSMVNAKVTIGVESLLPSEFIVATSWNTAQIASSFRSSKYHIYFVQDFEPSFYPMGSEYVFAENTYKLGMFGITAGDWLKEKLINDYSMSAKSFSFSYEKEIHQRFEQSLSVPSKEKKVFFYARSVTPRRAFELGMLVLDRLCKRDSSIEVILAGWDVGDYVIPFKHRNEGVVPHNKLPNLYNECGVALVISLTNLSLLPLELMACGCPVVSNRGPNVEWLLNEDICVLVDLDINDMVKGLDSVLNDSSLRNKLIENGLAFVQKTSWNAEGDKIVNAFKGLKNCTMD